MVKSQAKAYIGNKVTGVVHKTYAKGDACRVSEIVPKRRVFFETLGEALGIRTRGSVLGPSKKKFRPCKVCCAG